CINKSPNERSRPLLGGLQIQSDLHDDNSKWGTEECVLNFEGKTLAITNFHVLFGGFSEEFVTENYANMLKVFQNFNLSNNDIGIATEIFSKNLDYALFNVTSLLEEKQALNWLNGNIDKYVIPRIGSAVMKSGAKTQITYGIIDGRSCTDCS